MRKLLVGAGVLLAFVLGAGPGAALAAASSGDVSTLPQPKAGWLTPGLRKTGNGDYESRRLLVHADDIRDLRACLLEAAVKSFQPEVTLVEKHPFGARGEFRAGLEALKKRGGHAVLGLRDILDAPDVVRRELAEHGLQDRIESGSCSRSRCELCS